MHFAKVWCLSENLKIKKKGEVLMGIKGNHFQPIKIITFLYAIGVDHFMICTNLLQYLNSSNLAPMKM